MFGRILERATGLGKLPVSFSQQRMGQGGTSDQSWMPLLAKRTSSTARQQLLPGELGSSHRRKALQRCRPCSPARNLFLSQVSQTGRAAPPTPHPPPPADTGGPCHQSSQGQHKPRRRRHAVPTCRVLIPFGSLQLLGLLPPLVRGLLEGVRGIHCGLFCLVAAALLLNGTHAPLPCSAGGCKTVQTGGMKGGGTARFIMQQRPCTFCQGEAEGPPPRAGTVHSSYILVL